MTIHLPAAGAVTHCRSCGASIVWLMTGNPGKRMPVNAESVSQGELLYQHGKHVSHFSSCPQAEEWRKKR